MNLVRALVKVYGHVWPSGEPLCTALRPLLPPSDFLEPEEMLTLDKDLVRITFEGLYFPLDTVLEVFAAHLTPHSQGKLDYLDLEQWTLTRHRIEKGRFTISTVSLNHVLDYAGH